MESHRCINVQSKRDGKETVIEVRGWPGHSYEGWKAYTSDHQPLGVETAPDWRPGGFVPKPRQKKGRVINACGWHGLKKDMRVAELRLHVEATRPLQIQQFDSAPGLVELDRYAVRNFLLSCAVDIAKALEGDLAIDHGWLEWRVAEKYALDVAATAPGFAVVSKRRRPRLRGTDVILRREG